MARVTATKRDDQEGAQAPGPGLAPQAGGSPGLPQREAQGGAIPAPRSMATQPRDAGPPARRFRVKPNMAAMGDPSLKGGYRVMQPSSLTPGAPSYAGTLPAGRIVTDASHDIPRLLAQGVELEEILPPPPPPKAVDPAVEEEATA